MTAKQKALEAARRVYSDVACNRCTSLNCNDIVDGDELTQLDHEATKLIIAAYLKELDEYPGIDRTLSSSSVPVRMDEG